MSFFKYAGVILREATRHILHRPVVGALAVARTPDGRVLLIRRGDSGKWALPGGTLEWNETLQKGLAREIEEETGATLVRLGKVRAIYSRPDRDWRFHAVTIVVLAEVAEPVRGPHNPLEIREAKLFSLDALPKDLDFDGKAVLDQALSDDDVLLE
ncbi:MAG: NUDIX hydrolase [Polyangiaceae bacterium]